MTPKEFKAELNKLAKEIGSRADLTAFIGHEPHRDYVIYCSVCPRGMLGKNTGNFSVYGKDFPDLIEKVRAKWAEYSAEFRVQTVRKMALAIIRITSEIGACSDAALRDEFSAEEIGGFGGEACTEANAMADKGPFTITPVVGANGVPDEIPADATVN